MPSDSTSSHDESNLTLLRAYQVSPSANLEDRLVEIYMGLIRETIASLPLALINQISAPQRLNSEERRTANRHAGERRAIDRELLQVGKQAFKKALIQFDSRTDYDFSEDFAKSARSLIYQQLESFLRRQILDSRNEPSEP